MTAETGAERNQSSFAGYVRFLETASPEVVAERIPRGPDTAALTAHYPELGRVEVHDVTVDGAGRMPARLYREPGHATGSALVWAHGGAFVGGDLDMPEANWVGLTLASRGVPVLSVEYRKCLRGVHFPAPSDDLLTAWSWAVEHAGELQAESAGLHLGGASAGGNLAAGVTKRLRDGAGPLPASLLLVYAVLHARLPPASADLRAKTEAGQDLFPTADMAPEINLNFTGTTAALADPYAFPANGDVAGQPPVYVLNSDADFLRASGEAYAAQLAAASVPVRVEFEPGSRHGHLNEPFTVAGERSLDRMTAWLAAAAA
ncbi:alpha/beta hydrolase [Frankia sp. CNm7]|uniref:Alpha/beta hydrolase n=1 Tax=Frankia nepalensis TaxID=1836974 RepID=A0A937RNR9_9ACTN|nr:alpha/beta hydrolase [Frankia nepalensis]MBL7498237.1 alpha/beta hydrolase [Frankia nepalensis]MBL7509533.1 alpha/beta hydrolase [Frankia nepalensis]MBL7517279.1 alpha/beta hydrolase [Frankia nepalensis]MBL7632164.1 alpha/beta hydrolase [Frankia nepalensis]